MRKPENAEEHPLPSARQRAFVLSRAVLLKSQGSDMVFMKIIICLLLFATPALSQKSDDWWQMPGTQKANPKRIETPTTKNITTRKLVKWTFPRAGQTPQSINGELYYELTPGIIATRTAIGDEDIEAATVYFLPDTLAAFRLAQLKDPNDRPTVDNFLIMAAVHFAVEDPQNSGFHKYIGKVTMYGLLFYFYELKSGQTIAGHVSEDHSHVLILPRPSQSVQPRSSGG